MADVEILYDPITVNSGPVTVAVTGLDDIKVDAKLAVTQPIETKSALTLSVPDVVKTDAKLAFTIPDPIKTEAKAAIDLQPVIVDQCLRLSLGPLPPTLVCLPNRQRFGMTLFGVEVFSFTLDGEAQIVVSDLPKPPQVVSLAARPRPADEAAHEAGREAGHHHDLQVSPQAAAPSPAKPPPFIIRLTE